jgi:uncharacterized membrane protein
MLAHTPAHAANIAIHVIAGSSALVAGLVAILSPKRAGLHARAGMFFLYCYVPVVATAAVGLLVFDFRSFLAVVTILSIYDVFSGYRALQLRGGRPLPGDLAFSSAGFVAPWVFLLLMTRLHQPWMPVLTWSILGGLILTSGYDLCRAFLPMSWLRRTWVQEHLLKMMGAYIAITSAFAGTVFQRHMPWAAIIPSGLGIAVEIGFVVAGPRVWRVSQSSGGSTRVSGRRSEC